MSQNDLVIANQSFPSFRTDLNSALQAINTSHSGTSRPSGAVAGTIWLDTTSATSPTLKFYDGADDISLAIIDYTNNTVNWLDSSLSYNSTATSAGTLTLTTSSAYKQYFTGTTTHTVVLPVASTLTVGQTFEIHNNSTGSITVNSSGSNLVGTVEANVTAQCTCILASGTTAASWDFDVTGFTSALSVARGGTGLTALGSSLQVLRTNSGATGLEFATVGGLAWQTIVTASTLTAVASRGYWINTTSNACTVTLPASATNGDTIILADYARNWGTNAVTINQNSLNFQGYTSPNPVYNTNGQSVTLVYSGATQGWIPTVDDNVTNETPQPYSVDFLVVAGGGGAGSYVTGGGAGGFRTSTQTVSSGTVITVTVGNGGAKGAGTDRGTSGSSSSISGSGLTTITSAGGGGGGGNSPPNRTGADGGSGGGGGGSNGAYPALSAGGSGNTPSTSPSQGNNGGIGGTDAATWTSGGGGGGAGAVGGNSSSGVGGNGGNGSASSITGSSVTYAGGGGGKADNGTSGTGGTGGGGNSGTSTGTNGTDNLGGGGGGATTSGAGGNGGKGIVILSVPTASYSGTTSGDPVITTSGSNTILKFNGSGTYTG